MVVVVGAELLAHMCCRPRLLVVLGAAWPGVVALITPAALPPPLSERRDSQQQ